MEKNNKKAQSFIALISKPYFDFDKSLDEFCENCWEFEEFQDICFDTFSNRVKQIEDSYHKADAISKLIENSRYFPTLIDLAYKIFMTLSERERKNIKVSYISSPDDEISISQKEYLWRERNNLPCDKILLPGDIVSYIRPPRISDFQYYSYVMKIAIETGSETIFF